MRAAATALLPAVLADHWPTTDLKGRACVPDDIDSLEVMPSFHVHIAYNGWNLPEYQQAMRLLRAFRDQHDAPMCPFGHANCFAQQIVNGTLVSQGYDAICQLDPLNDFPRSDAKGFSAASTAFYVPHSRLYAAERWWRLHNEGANYFFHACSGCEDKDHTDWAMFSHGYRFPITTEALLCCHDGPPGCFCEPFFIFRDRGGRALTASIDAFPNVTADATVAMRPLPDPEPDPSISFGDGRFVNCAWKVTYYRPDWAQIEVQGYTLFNTWQCLAATRCEVGAPLRTVDCRGPGLTRMHPVCASMPPCDDPLIYIDDCPGLCVDPASAGAEVVRCPAGGNATQALR